MFRAQAKKYGATEKLWHTEWGYSTVRANLTNTSRVYPRKLRRSTFFAAFCRATALGVEHTFIYDFKDDGTNPDSDYENFGLIKNNRSPKQSYFALQRLTGLLAEMRMALLIIRPGLRMILPRKIMDSVIDAILSPAPMDKGP